MDSPTVTSTQLCDLLFCRRRQLFRACTVIIRSSLKTSEDLKNRYYTVICSRRSGYWCVDSYSRQATYAKKSIQCTARHIRRTYSLASTTNFYYSFILI
jgi:hypothetical protein